MRIHKVLFVGSPGAGKSTAIRAVSEIEVVDTDVKVSDATIKRKRTTTVGMDYGKLTLTEDTALYLYGTPGQERFKFMWDLMVTDLAHDASALVLLVDNTRNYPFKDIDFYLNEFWDYIAQRNFIIAVTRSDLNATPTKEEYENQLKERGIFAPVIFTDARKPQQVLKLVEKALGQDCQHIDWSQVSERIGKSPLEASMPEQPVIESTDEHPDSHVSAIEAAMKTRGIKGATHLNSAGFIKDTSVESGSGINGLFSTLLRLRGAIEQKTPTGEAVYSISLFGPGQDTISVFMEEDQAFGFVAQPSMTHAKIRQQADDLLQWSSKDVQGSEKA